MKIQWPLLTLTFYPSLCPIFIWSLYNSAYGFTDHSLTSSYSTDIPGTVENSRWFGQKSDASIRTSAVFDMPAPLGPVFRNFRNLLSLPWNDVSTNDVSWKCREKSKMMTNSAEVFIWCPLVSQWWVFFLRRLDMTSFLSWSCTSFRSLKNFYYVFFGWKFYNSEKLPGILIKLPGAPKNYPETASVKLPKIIKLPTSRITPKFSDRKLSKLPINAQKCAIFFLTLPRILDLCLLSFLLIFSCFCICFSFFLPWLLFLCWKYSRGSPWSLYFNGHEVGLIHLCLYFIFPELYR